MDTGFPPARSPASSSVVDRCFGGRRQVGKNHAQNKLRPEAMAILVTGSAGHLDV
jgi:hypothetical protein